MVKTSLNNPICTIILCYLDNYLSIVNHVEYNSDSWGSQKRNLGYKLDKETVPKPPTSRLDWVCKLQ